MTRGWLPQKAGLLGLNGGRSAAAVPPTHSTDVANRKSCVAHQTMPLPITHSQSISVTQKHLTDYCIYHKFHTTTGEWVSHTWFPLSNCPHTTRMKSWRLSSTDGTLWLTVKAAPHTFSYLLTYFPARPEIQQPLAEWSNWRGSESFTLETDVYVWRYALLGCMPEKKTKKNLKHGSRSHDVILIWHPYISSKCTNKSISKFKYAVHESYGK